MVWYEDLYVGYSLTGKRKEIVKKLDKNKLMPDIYVITLPENDYDTLEIYPSIVLTQKYYRNKNLIAVGIARGMEEARETARLIVMDCLHETGKVFVKKYILGEMALENGR